MKMVMVINKELPAGLIANTAAVLGISAGKMFEGIVGDDVQDADGHIHRGITTKTIPVLGAANEQIKGIRDILFDTAYADVTVVDFCEIAQRSLDYANYTTILSNTASSEIGYLGVCLYGPVKKINKLTGYLGLLR
jgi:hypothetical protein